MILLLLSSLAFGEAQFAQLAEGEAAPFSGRLLNDAAIAKIIIDQESIQESCQIAVDYELEIAQAKWSTSRRNRLFKTGIQTSKAIFVDYNRFCCWDSNIVRDLSFS